MNHFMNTGKISYLNENEKFISFNIYVGAKSANATGFYMKCSVYKTEWTKDLCLKEGMFVYVEGSLSINSYTNREGVLVNNPQLFVTRILEVGTLMNIDKAKNLKKDKPTTTTQSNDNTKGKSEIDEDEIPF